MMTFLKWTGIFEIIFFDSAIFVEKKNLEIDNREKWKIALEVNVLSRVGQGKSFAVQQVAAAWLPTAPGFAVQQVDHIQ